MASLDIGRQWRLIIGEQRLMSSAEATRVVENPALGEPLAEVAEGNAEDVDRAVRAATTAFKGPWGQTSGWERAAHLRRIATSLRAHLPELIALEVANAGKPLRETESSVARAAACFDYYADLAGRLYGETIPMPKPHLLDYTVREPLGVCGLIAPWNNPLLIACWKVAPALAAGNTVVLKPSKLTPLTALRLGEIALDAGLPPGVLNVVSGDPAVGQALVGHPSVRKIAFTGSTETGRAVMRQASETLKKVSLELGGKSPNIVFADANLERAVQGAVEGMFVNAGQSCTARSRLFVESRIAAEFSSRLAQAVASLRVGDPANRATEVGPLISASHRQHVLEYIHLGEKEGSHILVGGAEVGDMPGYYLQPTILSSVSNTMRVAQEEIFGPVLALMQFETETEAIALANESIYGLGATVWTSNLGRAHRVAAQLQAGNVSINYPKVNPPEAPFGGYNQSGLGRELGPHALELYTQLKNVLIDTSI